MISFLSGSFIVRAQTKLSSSAHTHRTFILLMRSFSKGHLYLTVGPSAEIVDEERAALIFGDLTCFNKKTL